MDDVDFEAMISRAKEFIAHADRVDARAGLATPGEVGAVELVRLAHSVLEGAVRTGNWDLAAHAFVYLGQALARTR